MNRTILSLASLVAVGATLGCDKKAPDASNTSTNGAPATSEVAAAPVALPTPAVDDAVKALLIDGDPGVVGRVRLGAWAEVGPTLTMMAERVDDPTLDTAFGALVEKGPVAAFESALVPGAEPAPPSLDAVDTTRPLWISLRMRGSGQSWGLFRLGVSLVSMHEPLRGWEAAALIPSKDPDELAKGFRRLPFGLEVATVGSHLRVSYLTPSVVLRGEKLPDLTPVEPMPWRMTPALARFLSEDAPASAYVRAEDLRVLTALDGLTDAVDALRHATPENRQKLLAMGTSVAMYSFLNAPRSVAEFEDHALLLGGDAGASGAFVDVVSTRTAFGRTVQAAAAARAVSLPSFSDTALPPTKALVDASYSHDIGAVAPLFAPFFKATRGPRADLTSQDARQLSGRLRHGGLFNYLTLLANSPTQLPALLSQRAPRDVIGDLRPVAARLRVIEATTGDSPGVSALAIAFDGDPEKLETLLPMLRAQIPPAINEALALEVTPAKNGGVLRASIGVALAKAFGPDSPLDPGAMRASAGLERLAGATLDTNVVAGLGDALLTMAHDPSTSYVRLGVSRKPLTPLAATAYTFEPSAGADVCVDVVSHEFVRAFDAMARLPPAERSNAFAPVVSSAESCAAKVPSPHWALLPHRLRLWIASISTPGGASEAAQLACAAGDEAGCTAKGYYDMIGEAAAPR